MKSLRVRLSAALLAALLVALLAISFETVRRADAVLSPEIERKAATLADSSAALIGKALALGIPADRLHGLDAHFARIVAENDDISWIALEGPDGAPLQITYAPGGERTQTAGVVSRPVPRPAPSAGRLPSRAPRPTPQRKPAPTRRRRRHRRRTRLRRRAQAMCRRWRSAWASIPPSPATWWQTCGSTSPSSCSSPPWWRWS